MKLLENDEFIVERAALADAVEYENGQWLVHDERVAAAEVNGWRKCVFADINDYGEYANKYGLIGKVCIMNAPSDTPQRLGFDCGACVTFAYTESMPPSLDLPSGVEIKRLGSSLAQAILDVYNNPGETYDMQTIQKLMREKGVFGAIVGGKLAGFMGRHGDGNMGMLEVFDGYRRRGLGSALERFMINYVMTFGRTPVCDVHIENVASLALQKKLGLKAGRAYTYWCEIDGV